MKMFYIVTTIYPYVSVTFRKIFDSPSTSLEPALIHRPRTQLQD